MTDIAVDVTANKGSKLFSKYADMINQYDDQQKEYLGRLSILKSLDMSKMTSKELIEIGNETVKLSKLGIEISETLNTFWSEFKEVVAELAKQFVDISIKVLSTALIGVILGL